MYTLCTDKCAQGKPFYIARTYVYIVYNITKYKHCSKRLYATCAYVPRPHQSYVILAPFAAGVLGTISASARLCNDQTITSQNAQHTTAHIDMTQAAGHSVKLKRCTCE